MYFFHEIKFCNKFGLDLRTYDTPLDLVVKVDTKTKTGTAKVKDSNDRRHKSKMGTKITKEREKKISSILRDQQSNLACLTARYSNSFFHCIS